jgi:hypothetical protein
MEEKERESGRERETTKKIEDLELGTPVLTYYL